MYFILPLSKPLQQNPTTYKTAGAIPTDSLRLRRNESFWTSLCVFCGRASARTTHTNWYYNLWSPLATHLYGDIASTGCARTTHTNWSYNLGSPLATHLYGDIASTVQDTIKKRISSGSR